ncbi:hypothetical protein QUF90_04970 [Desulfococcaceae bacterium HSG9]|nr:hypothetical protein [Desulfococcaceae bacterium HSG9]
MPLCNRSLPTASFPCFAWECTTPGLTIIGAQRFPRKAWEPEGNSVVLMPLCNRSLPHGLVPMLRVGMHYARSDDNRRTKVPTQSMGTRGEFGRFNTAM